MAAQKGFMIMIHGMALPCTQLCINKCRSSSDVGSNSIHYDDLHLYAVPVPTWLLFSECHPSLLPSGK